MIRHCGECAHMDRQRKRCVMDGRDVAKGFRACYWFDEREENNDESTGEARTPECGHSES